MAVAVMVDDFGPVLSVSAGPNRSVLVVDLVGHFAGWCLIDGQVVFGLRRGGHVEIESHAFSGGDISHIGDFEFVTLVTVTPSITALLWSRTSPDEVISLMEPPFGA